MRPPMRPPMFKFTSSQEVYEMCLRALLRSSKVHQTFLQSEGLAGGEDDFGRVHSNFTEAGDGCDGPLTLYLFLESVLTLGIALRSFLKTELPEKHHLANEGRMLEGALGDFMGTVLAMPPTEETLGISAKELRERFQRSAQREEAKAYEAKRDAIMRQIFVPKSRLNIWGQETPTEPETETRQEAAGHVDGGKVGAKMAEQLKARRKAGQIATLQDAYGGNPCREIHLDGTPVNRSEPEIVRIKAKDLNRSGASPHEDIFYSVVS